MTLTHETRGRSVAGVLAERVAEDLKREAELQAKAPEGSTIKVPGDTAFILTRAEIAEFEVASSEVEYIIELASNVCELLHRHLSRGTLSEDDGDHLTILQLSHRAFRKARDEEGAAMTRLSERLRTPRRGF